MKATRKLYAIGKEHFARQLLYYSRVKRLCIDLNWRRHYSIFFHAKCIIHDLNPGPRISEG